MKGNLQKKVLSIIKVIVLLIPLAYIISSIISTNQTGTAFSILNIESDIVDYCGNVYALLPTYLTDIHEIIFNVFELSKTGLGFAISSLVYSEMVFLFIMEVIEMLFNLVTFLFRKCNDFLGGVN